MSKSSKKKSQKKKTQKKSQKKTPTRKSREKKTSKKSQKSKPAGGGEAPAAAQRMRPVIGHDNRWWWDRIEQGELPIQRCKACGTLRHPPRPMCWKCQSLEWDHVVASGKGSVYSYVVVHRPPFPGYQYPLVVAVVELEEGTRIVSNLVGIDPQKVEMGMPVKVSVENVDETLKLPLFRPASGG